MNGSSPSRASVTSFGSGRNHEIPQAEDRSQRPSTAAEEASKRRGIRVISLSTEKRMMRRSRKTARKYRRNLLAAPPEVQDI